MLFNNAGISRAPARRVHEYEAAEWDRVLAVNLRGAFLVLRAALPLMLAGGGAVSMLTRQAALEYARWRRV